MAKQPKETIYAINASNGAYVSIPVTVGGCRLMEITECQLGTAAYSPQGLTYKKVDDTYTALFQATPGETISIGDKVANFRGHGNAIGFVSTPDPAGRTANPATIPVKLLSQSAATQVIVREWT